jgi:hypothetical protein
VAAAGAGVDRWLCCRGGRSRFRRDRFHRAHARPGPVSGRTDFLIGGIHTGRADALRQACLPARVLLSERIIIPGHISADQRICVLVGTFVPVADRIGVPEVISVRLPDPDPDPFHVVPEPDPVGIGLHDPGSDPFLVHVFARIRADERTSVRIGIGFYVTGANAGWRRSVLRTAGGHRVGTKIRCQGGTR